MVSIVRLSSSDGTARGESPVGCVFVGLRLYISGTICAAGKQTWLGCRWSVTHSSGYTGLSPRSKVVCDMLVCCSANTGKH